METQHKQKDDENIMTDENKIIDFANAAKIKAAGAGGGEDWLSQLPIGTTFLYRTSFRQPNSADVGVQLATVAFKYAKCTQLHSQVGENSPEVVYIVENIPFSNVMRKVEVLYVPVPDPE